MSEQFEIIRFPEKGMGDANTYLLINNDSKEGFVFDPAVVDGSLINYLKDNDITLKKILLTHGHYDHILNVQELKDATGAEVVISEKDADYLIDPSLNLSPHIGKVIKVEPADVLVKDGDKIELSPEFSLSVIETPGHTPGSICYLGDGFLVSGDLIFQNSIGRTDFEGGSMEDMNNSLSRIIQLPDETAILPGHGPITSIGNEKLHNYFLQPLL